MITCTRTFGFDAGHRVLRHEGKCATLHGHRYQAEVTCAAENLDALGRVIDFGKVKEVVGAWIDENWDHTMILNEEDPMVSQYNGWPRSEQVVLFGPRSPYIMPCNPTAENMAARLFDVATRLLRPLGIVVTHIKLYETPNCWASVAASPNML